MQTAPPHPHTEISFHFYLPYHYKEMYKQKHTMDAQLNALLPALHVSVISWAVVYRIQAKQKSWKTTNLMKVRQREVPLRGSLKEDSGVCASLACPIVNLVCERDVCSMEGIQFPLTCCFIPESVFLPLTASPARLLKRLWPENMENILFGIDIFLKIEKCLSRRQSCFRQKGGKKSQATLQEQGVGGCRWGVGASIGLEERNLGQRGDGGVQASKRSLVSLPTTQITPRPPHHGPLHSRCYSWGVMHPSLVLNLSERQTVLCLLECSREYLPLTPNKQPEKVGKDILIWCAFHCSFRSTFIRC